MSQGSATDQASLIERSGSAYRQCFGCGTENSIGLHLEFRASDGGVRAEFRPRPEYQGWDNTLHGGIILTVLDETLAYAALFAVGPAVTAEVRARLRRPAPLEGVYSLFGTVTKARLGLVQAHATLEDAAGRLVAEADGKLMVMAAPNGRRVV